MLEGKEKLGSAIWINPSDSTKRIEGLFEKAAESGVGWGRIFLRWFWIEHRPDEWRFRIYDDAFNAAQDNDILIKATLSPYDAPWHVGKGLGSPGHYRGGGEIGPPFFTHSKKVKQYIHRCVKRYIDHPALGQWILQNEPSGRIDRYGMRTDTALDHWRNWLEKRYEGKITELNERWDTLFDDFEHIPFPENILGHNRGMFNWGSWIEEWQWRAEWLTVQLNRIQQMLKEFDPDTETCVNPIILFRNRAEQGLNLSGIGKVVDVLGATHHPAWNFTFAKRQDYPAIVAAGVRLQLSPSSVKKAEVTEVQTGNTFMSGRKPCDVSPSEIAKFHLAGLAAGANSVTGWCLNTRSRGWETGDWALLDDNDKHSRRSRMLRRVKNVLDKTFEKTGDWKPYPSKAFVISDKYSHGHEWLRDGYYKDIPGRMMQDGIHGAFLLATNLMRLGIPLTISNLVEIPDSGDKENLIIASNQMAWKSKHAKRLLTFTRSGGTLVLDGVSGRMNGDASIHRPWPGGLASSLGIRGTELESVPGGFEVNLDGSPAGTWVHARMRAELKDGDWQAWTRLRFAKDDEPCVWERSLGDGRIIFARGLLGPSLLHNPESLSSIAPILYEATADTEVNIKPASLSSETIAIPVKVEKGSLTVVLSQNGETKRAKPFPLLLKPGIYRDFWNDEIYEMSKGGEIFVNSEEGISLLWREKD